MTTLADLRAALFPRARLVTPAAPDDGSPATASAGWVRVMRARVPAFDALEPGDIAIVPAGALELIAPTPADAAALATACANARIAGFLLVEGEGTGANTALDTLAGAAAGTGVPALRLPRAEIPELERSVVAYLVNARAELEHQAAELEARLERVALDGGGPADLVSMISAFLGRAVALEGRRGDPLAVHAPADQPDAAAAVATYHARRRTAAMRVPLPTGAGAAGALALLGDRPVGELERLVVSRIAGLLALELARDEAIGLAREARRAESLPSAGPPWVVLLARQRLPGQDDDSPGATERRELARREIRLLAPARRMALRGDADSLEIRAVMAVDPAGGPDSEGVELGGRLAAFLGRTVAVSRPFGSAADRPAAEAEARETLQAAEALPEAPVVARAARLAAYRLMGSLHNLPDGARHARALLAPLLENRADVRREHLETLRAVLDHGGVNEAASALGVHRNTIAYRLRRIEARTGWRLADPELRLPLALALRLVQEA